MSELKDFDINEFKIGQNLYIEASAGTGKTYTIELLVQKMLQNNIPLSKILIVTYTDKAAGELRDRIRRKIIDCLENNPNNSIFTKALQDIGNAQICTFHSFCQNVLNNFAYETKSSLNLELVSDNNIDSLVDYFIRDRWQILNDFQKLLNFSDFNLDDLKTQCINAVQQYNLFSDLKIEEIKVKENDRKIFGQMFVLKHFHELIDEWKNFKKNKNFISFSDMINLVHENVCKNNSILVERLREAYCYAIIDEFQDTNQKQWDIFRKIFLEKEYNVLPHSLTTACNDVFNNIVVVGDPKQSIFSFQGAEIEVYKKAIKEIGEENGRRLSTNYRSSKTMIDACNVLFKKENEKSFFGNSEIEFNKSIFPDENNWIATPLSEARNDDLNKKVFLNGKEVEPVWLAEPSDEYKYAKYAVSKLVECIKCDENGKTALQIYDKNENQMRSVKFSDFAVLARTRSEMPFIEDEMAKVGIPFYRYKDTSLFDGRECKEWISLLMLLDVPDFTAYNRKILNQALLTDFFRINLDEVESEKYVNPTKEPMNFILDWKRLAEKRLWAELKEKIFEDSQIEKYLLSESKATSLLKIRQIANYVFDYLFNHKVSIEEMVKHLNGLASKTEETDSEDELVENASDLDVVRIMTIYASKGLEFPIVIMVGSLRGFNNLTKGPFVYTCDDNKILGYDRSSKNIEDADEWCRLVYVAYTRAKYILILPDFSQKNRGSWKGNGPFSFLVSRMNNIRNTNFCRNYSIYNEDLKSIVDDFINNTQKKQECLSTKEEAEKQIAELQNSLPSLRTYQLSYSSISSNLKGKYDVGYKSSSIETSPLSTSEISLADSDTQPSLRAQEAPQPMVGELSNVSETEGADCEAIRGVAIQDIDLFQDDTISDDYGRLDKEESNDDDLFENDSLILNQFKSIDNPENLIKACSNYILNIKKENDSTDNYPKGARLGNAIHEVFELIRFENFGKYKEKDIYDIPELNNLIIERFEKQSLPIKANNNWLNISARIVWNTLNADLPIIHGSKVNEGKTFKLKSLSDKARKSEVEFLFDIIDLESNSQKSLSQESSLRTQEAPQRMVGELSNVSETEGAADCEAIRGVAIQGNENYKKLNNLCKGFIDLLFVRNENGNDYYSILDWKSDYMSEENYSNGEALAEKVNEEYTVQRVLYSYLLIKWLKQFYSDLSYEEIFEQHFGGIYYAFVRGCRADCSNGIYAQTWKNYKALEESYIKLLKELRK